MKTCRFPLWPHNAKPTHEYCGAKAAEGKPYCEAHCALCYVKPTQPQKVREAA